MSRYCMFHDNTTHAPVEQIPRLPSLADESRQMNIQGSCTSYIRSRQELRRICLGLSMACCHSALVPMACRLRASKIPVDSAFVGAIIGIVAVVVVLLITVAILTCICLRRRTRNQHSAHVESPVPDVKEIQHEYIGTTK